MGSHDIPVIILAGGKQDVDASHHAVPKVLLPYKDKPLIEHIIRHAASFGFSNIMVYLSAKNTVLKKTLRLTFPQITFLEEQEIKGSASALITLSHKKIADKFIVIYGDNFYDLNFDDMLALHDRKKAVATVALTEVKDPEKYGTVCSLGGTVIAFYEKMDIAKLHYNHIIPPYRVDAGYYVFSKDIFSYVAKVASKPTVSLEKDVLPLLIEEKKLAGYSDDGTWVDADTLE